jgi:hypothetical protein
MTKIGDSDKYEDMHFGVICNSAKIGVFLNMQY